MEIIEKVNDWRERYRDWQQRSDPTSDDLSDYPFIENRRAPFIPLRRALPLLNLALVSSAGAYVDGTEPFDTKAPGGDVSFREIPTLVEPEDLRFVARGYDPAAVQADINAQIPLQRLFEFEDNNIIGRLVPAFWSFCGFITDAARFVEEAMPRLIERIRRYEAQAVLLIPASRLCHQTMGLAARAIEAAGIPTMMIAVEREVTDLVRPPRAGYYPGQFGAVAGQPNWPEHQKRVLDEALRLLEPMSEPDVRRLSVDIETEVELQRGEK